MTTTQTPDPLDILLGKVGQRRSPHVPLFITISEVFRDCYEEIDPTSLAALGHAGHAFLTDSLADDVTGVSAPPGGDPLPGIDVAFRAVERVGDTWPDWPLEQGAVSDEEGLLVCQLGFMAIAGERLMDADAGN